MTLLSVEAAARRGVIEAKIWDRTGVPPASPEHRLQDIPFRPEPGFVGGRVRRLSLFVRLAQVHAPKGGVSIGGKQFKGGEFIPGDVLKNATIDERDQILSGMTTQDKKTPKRPASVKPAKPPQRKPAQFPGAKVDRRIRDGFPKDSSRKKRLRAGSTERLSDEQTEWLTTYTDESESLNSALRQGSELTGDAAEMFGQLNAAIEQSEPLPEGTTVYRGLDLSSQELMDSMLSRFENSIGQDLRLKGITSTSLDPEISAKFSKRESFVMEIQPKKGLYANGVSEFPDEEEILLKHNAQYRVVSVQRGVRVGSSAFRTVVQLKEV